MEKKLLDWSEIGKIPSRKWQTSETIDTLHLGALRLE